MMIMNDRVTAGTRFNTGAAFPPGPTDSSAAQKTDALSGARLKTGR